MLKTNLTHMLMFVFLLSTLGATAQNILWGAGHSNTTIDSLGKFSMPFNQTGSWQSVSLFDAAIPACTQNTPGNAFWVRSLTGRSQGNYFGTLGAMTSPSVADGVAIFDSDYLDNNGTSAFNSGTSPAGYTCNPRIGHAGELQSPSIDLSGYTDSTISVRFHLYYRPFTLRELSFGISTNGGAAWTDFDIDQGVTATFPTALIEVPLHGVLDGVANLTDVKIRFKFDGLYYFAMVDDVHLVMTPDYDFAISGPTSGSTLGDGFTTTYTSDYRYSPYTQQDISNFFFTARITNRGAQPILPANNARIKYIIEKNSGGTWMPVYMDSIAIDTVLPNERYTPDESYLSSMAFIDTFATYRGTLIATHDLPDGNGPNDTMRHVFDVTEREFSKCRKSADGSVFSNRSILPAAGAGNVLTEFEYGSMFYVPNGTTNNVVLDSVNFKVIFSTATAASFTVAPITVRVYEFNDLDNSGTLNASPSSGELTLVGLGIDSVPKTTGVYISRTVNIINISDFTELSLSNDMVYLVTLDQRNPNGMVLAGQYYTAFLGADELNYSLNGAILAMPNLPPRNPAPVRVADANAGTLIPASDDWNWVGFGADIQPSIRLLLKGDLNPWPVVVGVTTTSQEYNAGMELFPNPTGNTLNLKVSFDKEMDNATYILSSVNGQIIEMVGRNNIQNEVYSFEVSHLPQGVYFLTVRTTEGAQTQRFVKQ